MNGKILVSAVSLILVVGVVIGTVVVVNKKNEDSGIAAHQNVVKSMCQNTEDQKLCHDTLSSVKDTDSKDPIPYLGAAVEGITKTVIKALNMSDQLVVEHEKSDAGIKMALDDCKDLMQSALDSLESSANLLRGNNINSVNNQIADFRNWLAAVISYQSACMEGFDTDGEKKVMEQLNTEGLDQMEKLTGIALDIVANLAKLLDQFGLKLDVQASSRRLMGVEVDDEGFPTWFSAADRKLLGRMHRGRARIAPNVVVAKDGSGKFRTVKEAIDSYPKGFVGRYVIYVKAGIYDEYITVPKYAVNVLLYGDGPTRTIITGRKNFIDGTKTMQTATFANIANGFIAKSIAFENYAGPAKHQAVALRNQGDAVAFFDVAVNAFQDSLYVQSNRAFFRNCVISGTVDFIFGVSTTLIQNSRIIVRKPLPGQFNTVTADGTKQRSMNTGIVIQNCEILPERDLFPQRFQVRSYLGRPWKAFSRAVVMESNLGDFIHPDGWCPWDGDLFLNTLYFAEYANFGPGSNVQRRVRWKGYRGLIGRDEAARYTAGQFLRFGPNSRAEDWLLPLRVPFDIGFTR